MSASPNGGERPPAVAVVLAAGKGTRMRSELPKVLHRVAGRPMLEWVLDAVRAAGCERILVVVGHQTERVQAEISSDDITWVEQTEQLGTGHALAQTRSEVSAAATLLVVSGDVPLVLPGTLRGLLDAAAAGWGAMAVAELEEPGSLGRVIAADGRLERIVEAADARPEELSIGLINAGLYALPAPEIFTFLDRLGTDNAKGELYLTDALGDATRAGRRVSMVHLERVEEGFGVNTRAELAEVHRRLLARRVEALSEVGVTVLDPGRTVVETTVAVGADTVLHPGVALLGETVVGSGCEIRQGAWLSDCEVGDGVVIEPYSVLDGARVGHGCRVGPFARLRPGSLLEAGAKVGNFVEVKNSRLGEGVKAGHLAYLGDAEIGAGANIGAGTVTCNYDGESKHPTTIGEGAFIGSDTMLVAPVSIGEGATTGAGSVITRDLPPGSLGVERARQRTVEGWRDRRRKADDGGESPTRRDPDSGKGRGQES